jgi:hypothetical protein
VPPHVENNKGAEVIRGTGQSAFAQAGFDVRTIYDGDMSQINYHRWMNKISPCYDRYYCNETIAGDKV